MVCVAASADEQSACAGPNGRHGDKVTSAIVQVKDGVLRNGRPSTGGMWVRGLCQPCNGLAGQRYDLAYADFAKRLATDAEVSNRVHLLRPGIRPPYESHQGLVSRSSSSACSPSARTCG